MAVTVAHDVIRKSKSKQKAAHDKKASDTTIRLGDKICAYVSYQEWASLQVSSTIQGTISCSQEP